VDAHLAPVTGAQTAGNVSTALVKRQYVTMHLKLPTAQLLFETSGTALITYNNVPIHVLDVNLQADIA
jgi:hypothetical protein